MSNTVKERSEPLRHRRSELRHVPAWLAVVLLIVLLGAGVFVGRVTKADPSPPPDLASASTNASIRDQVAAINSGDAARIRPFYADNATMNDIGNRVSAPLKGGAHIAETFAANHSMLGHFLDEPGTAVQRGQFMWAIHPAQ